MKKKIRLALATLATALVLGASSAFAAQLTHAQKAQLFLRGAKLWPTYCSQCHKARPGSQFSPEKWDTIMMHMRSRANLTADDAEAIVQYLKGGR